MKKWRCAICGYVHEGPEPPDKCPVCMAPAEKFVIITSEAKAPSENKTVARWKCKVCGYVHEGIEPPDKCPVCMAPDTSFEKIIEQAANNGKNAIIRQWKCLVCGYIHEGDGPPERCPVCKAAREKFVVFEKSNKREEIIHADIFDALETAAEAPKRVTHIKTDDVNFDTYYFLPGQALDYHKHPTGDQIFVVIQGSGEFYLDDGHEKVIKLKPGTVVLAAKDIWHKVLNTSKNILILCQTTHQPSGLVMRN